MSTIAFLACETTLPGSRQRRTDAYEHDLMVAALEPALTERGMSLRVIDWEADLSEFEDVDLALLGSSWNYQDKHEAFLVRLDALEAIGIAVCNPAEVVRWNSRKTYLQELAERGVATIPTLWLDDPDGDDIRAAMREFGCDRLVVKRQIGAGAEGQLLFKQGDLPAPGWRYGHKAMLQPFLPTIEKEGELSMIMIDGEFNHALRKIAASGDYRIQSLYGGSEQDYAPTEQDIAQVRAIIDALPFAPPLYARIDMLRADDGTLLLMEAEMIEPYLYPEQGAQLGSSLARAIAKRFGK
ncbi:MAG: ATP-grasp domain-containing protein [Erythrobacter sp.]